MRFVVVIGALGRVMMLERGVRSGGLVMLGVGVVRMSEMRMMAGELMIAIVMRFVSGVMMFGGFLVMMSSLLVMVGGGCARVPWCVSRRRDRRARQNPWRGGVTAR